jgi:hypothetical protein
MTRLMIIAVIAYAALVLGHVWTYAKSRRWSADVLRRYLLIYGAIGLVIFGKLLAFGIAMHYESEHLQKVLKDMAAAPTSPCPPPAVRHSSHETE